MFQLYATNIKKKKKKDLVTEMCFKINYFEEVHGTKTGIQYQD